MKTGRKTQVCIRNAVEQKTLQTVIELHAEMERRRFVKFVLSSKFDHVSALIIFANSLFIGVQIDHLFDCAMTCDHTNSYMSTVDILFTSWFIVELLLRMYALGPRTFFLTSDDKPWNIFDFTIVVFSSIDTIMSLATVGADDFLGDVSLFRILRLIRITRVLRIIRVMRFFKDLRVMVSAIGGTLKTAGWALVLLGCAIYMFGVAVAQFTAEHIDRERKLGRGFREDDALLNYFGSLGKSLFSLLMSVAGGVDWEVCFFPLTAVGPEAVVTFVFFILFVTFCMMNVILGIFCHTATIVFDKDSENVIEMHLEDKKKCVTALAEHFSARLGGRYMLSTQEFEQMCIDPVMQGILKVLDIDRRDASCLFDILDADELGEIELEELIGGCILLRGYATRAQIEKYRSEVHNVGKRVENLESLIVDSSRQLLAAIDPKSGLVNSLQQGFDQPKTPQTNPSAPRCATEID
jgi:hypothetical protein